MQIRVVDSFFRLLEIRFVIDFRMEYGFYYLFNLLRGIVVVVVVVVIDYYYYYY